MISARVFIICFCACVFGIEGARTQTKGIETALEKATKEQEFGIEGKAIETALEKATKEQEAVSESITGEAEAEDTEEGNLQPQGCKPFCNRAGMGNSGTLDISKSYGMVNTKCTTHKKQCGQCKRCLEQAETKIDVAPPPLEHQRGSEEASRGDGEHEVLKDVVPVVPFCTMPATKFEKECKLMHNGEVLTCAHYKTAWCNLETAGFNPNAEGHYRYHDEAADVSWPLCCKTPSQMSDKIVTGVEENTKKIETEFEAQRANPGANRNHEAVPVCSDSIFRKETQIDGTTVCRDQGTNELFDPACCEGEVSGQLVAKEAADTYCSEVPDKWCKTNIDTFEKKRTPKKLLPFDKPFDGFTCIRKYMCCFQDLCLGPVSSQAMCTVINKKTGDVLNLELAVAMTKAGMAVNNLAGRAECVAVAK